MVKVNGKMVPFFAADGKGSGDLKKAMYGMKMKSMGDGGKMYKYKEGGEIYQIMENGGEVEQGGPIGGMPNLQGRFRVIPEPVDFKRKDSPIAYKFYIDGEEVESTTFGARLREEAPNVDMNEMVSKATDAAGLRWSPQSGGWFYGGGRDFDDTIKPAMEERKAFREGGAQKVDSLYNVRADQLQAMERAPRANLMEYYRKNQ